MSMQVDMEVKLKLKDKDYGIKLLVPAEISWDHPCTFGVGQILTVATAGTDQVYLEVQPPNFMLEPAQGMVEDLKVEVNEGGYNKEKGTFAKPDSPKPDSPKPDSPKPDSP